MEHHLNGMSRKWERHYRETRTTISYGCILFGISFALPLLIIYPQVYSAIIFNSRLNYHTLLSSESCFTCNKEYVSFITDEPPSRTSLLTFYLFNVSNAAFVWTRGYKPAITEVGPYSYKKNTYKYDVSFNPEDSSQITFKEYTSLSSVSNSKACTRMFHMLDRGYSQLNDPCIGGACDCREDDESVTIVNPLFLKLIWQESSQDLVAYYSSAVFENIRTLLTTEFISAVKYHLAPAGLREVYFFRQQMQMNSLLNVSFSYLLQLYSAEELSDLMVSENGEKSLPSSCGLSFFGITSCPIGMYQELSTFKSAYYQQHGSYPASIPSLSSLMDARNPVSFLNAEVGLPLWMGSAYCLGFTTFNANAGYTMINKADCQIIARNLTQSLAQSATDLDGSLVLVKTVSFFLMNSWFTPFVGVLTRLNFDEFVYSSEVVTCSPLGVKCVWQYGYMVKFHGSRGGLTYDLVNSLLEFSLSGKSNPNSFYYDGNSAAYFNSYKYCHVVYANPDNYDKCLNISYTVDDATVSKPAGYWGIEYGISLLNMTNLIIKYKKQSPHLMTQYQEIICNMSSLLFEVYPLRTEFHDEFVIRYINKNKNPKLLHTFEVGKWEDLAWAQWGGGFVTMAVAGVPSVYQILRNGMWVIGDEKYINGLVEYGAWCLYEAYPQAFLFNLTESKILLTSLSSSNSSGVDFRRNIVNSATTFVGDGIHFENGVGDVGDITFDSSNDRGDYSCPGIELATSCEILDVFFNSSGADCSAVQGYYDKCLLNVYQGSTWVANCDRFQTAITSTTTGVQCDLNQVFQHPHPHLSSRGSILFAMLLQMTVHLVLENGLWCSDPDTCDFGWGGLFTTTTARKALFEGFTDPSVLRYLNMKYKSNHIKFSCADERNKCGEESLKCSSAGVLLELPNQSPKLFRYGTTPNDEFFAPYIQITEFGELLWPFAMDANVAKYSREKAQTVNVTQIFNPFWAAHPAWKSEDVAFNKYIQCQKRLLSGMPDLYQNCFDTVNTGSVNTAEIFNIETFAGNKTQRYFQHDIPIFGSTFPHNQHEYFGWSGFKSYPYSYFAGGGNFTTKKKLTIFDKKYGLPLTFSQKSLSFEFERNIPISFPLPESWEGSTNTTSLGASLRRFVEDESTWETYRSLGSPKDSYGMPYLVPHGMASLETRTNFPVFIGTVHCLGNKLWGGTEFADVSGYSPNVFSQRSFIDYEPITGKGMRTALRQQIMLRVERGPLLPNIISSQDRCIVPTKTYQGGSGYGCFAYVPLYWSEDARVQDVEHFFRLYDHFYTRPERAALLSYVGLAIGFCCVLFGACLYVHEQHHRRNFSRRVYVD